MKRIIYTALAGAVLMASSSNLAMAKKGKGKDGKGGHGGVVMCYQPGNLNIEVEVDLKDVLENLNNGFILGGCPTDEIIYPE